MIERDIWLTANTMVKRYGVDAELQASLQADSLLDEGDIEGQRVWLRITNAIRVLTSTKTTGEIH